MSFYTFCELYYTYSFYFLFRDFSTTKIASKSADTPLNFKRESLITPKSLKKEKFSLISLPHNVSFSDLATKMHPISVEGLENITGILGRLQENDDDNVSNEKSLTKCKTTGKPTDGALVWAHIAFFIEGKTEPFESSAFRGEAQVLIVLF